MEPYRCSPKGQIKLADKALCLRQMRSFGAWRTILPYLTPKQQVFLQLLCQWTYQTSIPRAQIAVSITKIFWMPSSKGGFFKLQSPQNFATFIDSESTTYYDWVSVPIKQCIFQFEPKTNKIRILEHMGTPSFRSIEKPSMRCCKRSNISFCSMRDRFVVASGGFTNYYVERWHAHTRMPNKGRMIWVTLQRPLPIVERFDVNRDVWEELPSLNIGRFNHGICAFEDILYVIGGEKANEEEKFVEGNYEKIKHYVTSAMVEKLDMGDPKARWQIILVPPTSLEPLIRPILGALGPNEILIIGGHPRVSRCQIYSQVLNTKSETVSEYGEPRDFWGQQSIIVETGRPNTVVLFESCFYSNLDRLFEYKNSTVSVLWRNYNVYFPHL